MVSFRRPSPSRTEVQSATFSVHDLASPERTRVKTSRFLPLAIYITAATLVGLLVGGRPSFLVQSEVALTVLAPLLVLLASTAGYYLGAQHTEYEVGEEQVRAKIAAVYGQLIAQYTTQLASPEAIVRVGAIHALRSLGEATPLAARLVSSTLLGFVRQQTVRVNYVDAGPASSALETFPLSGDIQVALEALGSLPSVHGFKTGYDLSNLDLSGARLSGLWFNGSDFSSSLLRGADFDGASLAGVDLRQANLAGATAIGAEFSRAMAAEATFDMANLAQANFNGALLSAASMKRVFAAECSFEHALLANADLSNGDFRSANFSDAYLEGASLDGANLTEALVAGADLSLVALSGTRLPVDFDSALLTRQRRRGTKPDQDDASE